MEECEKKKFKVVEEECRKVKNKENRRAMAQGDQ